MSQARCEAADRLRAAWEHEWIRASAGSAAERAALLDSYARLHAASCVDAPSGAGDLLVDLDGVDPLGQRWAARIVRRILGVATPAGSFLPVLAAEGRRPLRVERSRPDWHLNGAVHDVGWPAEVDFLAVFAVDEGDNDVLAMVAPGTEHVAVTRSAGRPEAVDICFGDVALPGVTHCPGELGLLADGLTVLAMGEVITATGWLLARTGDDREEAELALCLAAAQIAAQSLASMSLVRRQHDVSSAALLVLSTGLRVADSATGHTDPEVAERVRAIRGRVGELPVWHRERLVALV